jgi:hypothetical protein
MTTNNVIDLTQDSASSNEEDEKAPPQPTTPQPGFDVSNKHTESVKSKYDIPSSFVELKVGMYLKIQRYNTRYQKLQVVSITKNECFSGYSARLSDNLCIDDEDWVVLDVNEGREYKYKHILENCTFVCGDLKNASTTASKCEDILNRFETKFRAEQPTFAQFLRKTGAAKQIASDDVEKKKQKKG